MSSVIKVTPNKNGRYIIKLYNKEFDVTNIVGEDGKGTFEAFGEIYNFEAFPSKTVMKRKTIMESAKAKAEEKEVKDEA